MPRQLYYTVLYKKKKRKEKQAITTWIPSSPTFDWSWRGSENRSTGWKDGIKNNARGVLWCCWREEEGMRRRRRRRRKRKGHDAEGLPRRPSFPFFSSVVGLPGSCFTCCRFRSFLLKIPVPVPSVRPSLPSFAEASTTARQLECTPLVLLFLSHLTCYDRIHTCNVYYCWSGTCPPAVVDGCTNTTPAFHLYIQSKVLFSCEKFRFWYYSTFGKPSESAELWFILEDGILTSIRVKS